MTSRILRNVPEHVITEIRDRALAQIKSLPEEFKRLRNPEIYRVFLSEATGDLKEGMLENPDSI